MTDAINRAEQIMSRYAEMTGDLIDANELTDAITDLVLWGFKNGLDSADSVRAAMALHAPAER
ncbi:hypothetical protein [Streptomyces sp. NPDC002232]|uniref:hypothetical protein n=1 Tax=Streptomyces sp. NPDC002232 TaxID=3364640 RepID=UPI003691676C